MTFAIALGLTLLTARAEDTLRVRAEASVVAGAPVRLSQLVESTESLGSLGDTVVRDGLAAGSSDVVSGARLNSWFRPIVSKARAEGRVLRLGLPPKLIITASTREFTAATIASELIEGWRSQCGACRLEIEGLNLPQVGRVRAWSIKSLPTLPRGPFSVALEIHRDKAAPTVGWVSGRVLVKRRVPVAKRLLPVGERLRDDDFAFEYRDTAQAYDGIPEQKDLTGHKLVRPIANGDVVWKGSIERERAIHRGDLVQLRASDKDWEVSIGVIAPQDAVVGDVLNFKNTRTNATVVGRVTAPGQAEIQ
jgi:flagella basal body P-ring formation protein FlgA